MTSDCIRMRKAQVTELLAERVDVMCLSIQEAPSPEPISASRSEPASCSGESVHDTTASDDALTWFATVWSSCAKTVYDDKHLQWLLTCICIYAFFFFCLERAKWNCHADFWQVYNCLHYTHLTPQLKRKKPQTLSHNKTRQGIFFFLLFLRKMPLMAVESAQPYRYWKFNLA